MLWTYALKAFEEQLNEIKVDGCGITNIENFPGTTTDITLEITTWRCPVYVLDAILQGRIAVLTKWEPQSRAGIYLGHSPFCSGLVALVLNSATGHVSPQFNVVFNGDFPHFHS